MESMTKLFRAAIVSFAILFAFTSPSHALLVIDEFKSPATPDALAAAFGGSDTNLGAATDVGYTRDTTLTAGMGSVLTAVVGGDLLVEITSLDLLGTGGSLTLDYSGGPFDLGPTGEDTLVIEFLSIDTQPLAGGSIFLDVFANASSVLGIPLVTSSSPTTLAIPFSAFAPANTFASISDLVLDFKFDGALTNMTIDSIYTVGPPSAPVPEPGTVAVWALVGLTGFGLVKFRGIWL
jgi:hypothetical protein